MHFGKERCGCNNSCCEVPEKNALESKKNIRAQRPPFSKWKKFFISQQRLPFLKSVPQPCFLSGVPMHFYSCCNLNMINFKYFLPSPHATIYHSTMLKGRLWASMKIHPTFENLIAIIKDHQGLEMVLECFINCYQSKRNPGKKIFRKVQLIIKTFKLAFKLFKI